MSDGSVVVVLSTDEVEWLLRAAEIAKPETEMPSAVATLSDALTSKAKVLTVTKTWPETDASIPVHNIAQRGGVTDDEIVDTLFDVVEWVFERNVTQQFDATRTGLSPVLAPVDHALIVALNARLVMASEVLTREPPARAIHMDA